MAKYEVTEVDVGNAQYHRVCVSNGPINASCFFIRDYGIDEASRRADAECKWLNERAEKWEVREEDFAGNSNTRRFRVLPKNGGGAAGVFFVNELGHDLARAEAERLCKILNDLDKSK
jgi:hypothetical protein